MPARKKSHAVSVYSLATDITEDNPFNLREMSIFIGIYTVCVLILIVLYEWLMPVFNNPTYPFYNHVHNYEFNPPKRDKF